MQVRLTPQTVSEPHAHNVNVSEPRARNFNVSELYTHSKTSRKEFCTHVFVHSGTLQYT